MAASTSERRLSQIPVAISSLPRNVANYDLASQALASPVRPQAGQRQLSPSPTPPPSTSPSQQHQRPEHYAKLGLTRLPVSVVSQGRSLSNGAPPSTPPHQGPSSWRPSSPPPSHSTPHLPSSPLLGPPGSPSTPNRSNQSSRVILDLQQALEATKAQLSSSQAELKASQRQVVGLAKENEDLKERRERARLESEGLNGVVARKERLLQETMERARTAEAEAKTLRDSQKDHAKSLSTLQQTLSTQSALLTQSETAYIVLSSSLATLRTQCAESTASAREDHARLMGQGERLKAEQERLAKEGSVKVEMERLRTEREELEGRWAGEVKGEMEGLRKRLEVLMGGGEGEDAEEELRRRVEETGEELAVLRRMIKKGAAYATISSSGDKKTLSGPPPRGREISPPLSPSPSASPSTSTIHESITSI